MESRQSSRSPPPKKKQRLPVEFDWEDDDLKSLDQAILDLSNADSNDQAIDMDQDNDTNTNTNTNTNNSPTPKPSKRKYKYTKADKLSSMGQSVTSHGTDLEMIRKELFSVLQNPVLCKSIINRIRYEQTVRAQGGGSYYEKKVTRDGRTINKKMEFLSHIVWARKVPPKGGADTNFSVFENTVLIWGAYQFVDRYAAELKCDRRLAPDAAGNVGKIFDVYVMMNVLLKYGEKYSSECWLRKRAAIKKRTTKLMTKKRTDLDSLTTREIFSDWGSPNDVQQTSYVYIRDPPKTHKFTHSHFIQIHIVYKRWQNDIMQNMYHHQ